MSLLLRAIQSVLDSWPAFRICVAHGCGDAERVAWFPEAIEQWLGENEDVYADELEETLAAILDSEFDTVVEDGSLRETSSRILHVQALCLKGSVSEVEALISINQASGANAVPTVAAAEVAGDDSDDEPQASPGPSLAAAAKPAEPAPASEEPMEVEDGWEVVRRKKR